jgi:PBSX family phage terminase large subunit
MRNIWGAGLVGNISSDNTVKLFGKKAYALGADKKNSVAKIQGASIEYCYGDEVTTWSEEVFQMLKSRLDKPNSVFDGTCNPDNPNHWFKAFLDSDADIYHQHYTIDDNPFLDPFFVEQLKKEYAGSVYYQRFILGQWARAEGLVYDMFYEDKNVVKTIDRPYTDYYVAVDYGTQNATVFGLFGMYRGKWYLIKEYYYSGRDKGRQKTDSQYADDLQAFIDGIPIMHVIIDPSAASFKAELRQRGIATRDANNDVLNGIRYTGGLLSNERLLINDCCTKTIDEFYTYSWDDKASLLGEDKPLKEDDHCMDMIRYFSYTIARRYYKGR